MKKLFIICCVFLILGFGREAYGSACQSNATGYWSAAGTWTNCNSTTPQSTDTVTILSTHTVTLNTNATIQTIDIQNNGALLAPVFPDACEVGSGTLTLGATSGTLFTLTGTFTHGECIKVAMKPNANVTLTSGAITFYDLTLSPALDSMGGGRIYTFGAGALAIDGNFTINPSSADKVGLTVNMGANITVASGKTTLITGTVKATSVLDTRPVSTDYALSTGFLNIATGGTLDATGALSVITLTGTSGTLFTLTGAFTQGTSEVKVTSASGTPTLLSAATIFHKLTINSTATVINMGAFAPTINNVAGAALYIQAGVFNAGGASITGPGATNGALTIDSGATFCLGGTTAGTNATCNSGATDTAARSMPTFQTYTFNAASTVRYLSNAAQTVLQTPTYGNLTLSPTITAARIYTMGAGALAINGDFTINPSAASALALTVNMGANITVASTKTTLITRTTSATSVLDTRPVSTDYALSTGFLNIATGGTLDATGALSVITLTGTSGTLFTLTGAFTQGTSEVKVTSASGTPTLLSAATIFHKLTINSTATVINMGAFAPTINNVAGAALYIQAGVFNAGGASITGPGATNGALTIDSGATFCLGGTTASTNATCNSGATDTAARSMPTFQTYTFNAASTVRYLSNAAQTVLQTPTYGNLILSPTITAARIYTMGAGALTINGDFTINPSAASALALTVNMGADITVAAAKTTLITRTSSATSVLDTRPVSTDYALSTGFLNIATGGTLDAASSASVITVSGGWTNNGTFTAGSSTVELTGTADQTIITNAQSFNGLTINNTGASGSDDIVISGNLDIDGILTIADGDLDLGGTALNLNLAGDLSIAANGRFTKGTGTFIFDGTTQNASDSSTGGPQSLGAIQIGIEQIGE